MLDRGVLTVFAHLEIIRQVDSVEDDVMRPGCKVHVADRAFYLSVFGS